MYLKSDEFLSLFFLKFESEFESGVCIWVHFWSLKFDFVKSLKAIHEFCEAQKRKYLKEIKSCKLHNRFVPPDCKKFLGHRRYFRWVSVYTQCRAGTINKIGPTAITKWAIFTKNCPRKLSLISSALIMSSDFHLDSPMYILTLQLDMQ